MREQTGNINNQRTAAADRLRNKPGFPVLALLVVGILSVVAAGCRNKETGPPLRDVDMTPDRVVGIGRIEPELRFLELSSEVSGIVTGINYRPGEIIQAGKIIVELSSRIEKARMNQSSARLDTQKSQIAAAEAALKAAQIRADNAGISFERSRTLYNQDAEAKAQYDAAKTNFEALVEDVRGLEAQLVAARNLLRQYQADFRLAQAEYDRRFIKAPVDGLLLTLDLTLGSLILPQSFFGTFAPQSPLVARCEIDELFADLVLEGQKAIIRKQGGTDAITEGVVTFTGPGLKKKSLFADDVGDLEDRRVREVWITLDPRSEILFGSRVECVILLGNDRP